MVKHHSSPDFSKLPNFPKTFQSKYLIGKRKTRIRKFTPKTLFHTLVELVAGTNKDGYVAALLKSFDFVGKKGPKAPPSKGSLSKIRARISYKFFRDFFLSSFHCLSLIGLRFGGYASMPSMGLRSHCPGQRIF